MLSYKLKHLCSRVIASLSAVGLFSVNTGAAQAATYTYQRGDVLKAYNVLGNTTFSANMTEMSPVNYCLTGSAENVADVRFNGANCEYECASGYAFSNATNTNDNVPVTVITGDLQIADDGDYLPYTLTDTCNWGMYGTCKFESGSYIISSNYISGDDPRCEYKCEHGYHASNMTPSGLCADGKTKGCGAGETGWAESGMAGDFYTTNVCLPNKYVLTFDCGGSGQISGTTGQTMSKDAVYNSSFVIPSEAICIREGYKMEGWNSDKKFEKQ